MSGGVIGVLRNAWLSMPEWMRSASTRTGLPYVGSYITRYSEIHQAANFAGNLEALKIAYQASGPDARADLDRRFEAIVDSLVMPNGVKKTTYAKRQAHILAEVLAAVQLPRPEIDILDLPASTGIASLENAALVSSRYTVQSYVLGDLYHSILYDRGRRCVFDDRGHLLQVGGATHYKSVYKGHKQGEHYTWVSALLLWPYTLAATYLTWAYPFLPGRDYQRLLVVHPEVEQRLAGGAFRLEIMDVFEAIAEQYDLILSFNLLQRNYFDADAIARGTRNLTDALRDGGVLVLGDTESFLALQKRDGKLVRCLQQGEF